MLSRSGSIIVVGLVVLSGCRFKAGESFTSATTPNPPYDAATSEWKGDKYAASTLAEASGGTKPASTYSQGARPQGDQKIDPSVNRPSFGTGQGPGELGNGAMSGHEQTNAPAFQAEPHQGSGGQ